MGLLSNKNNKKSLSSTSNLTQSLSADNNSTSTYSMTSCLANTNSTATNTASNYVLGNNSIIGSTGYISTFNDSVFCTPDTFEKFIDYFTEAEIREFLSKIIERDTSTSDNDPFISRPDKNIIISQIIRNRHFSEEFLLEYFEYVAISDIMVNHAADIKSQQYSSICLLIEGKKLC